MKIMRAILLFVMILMTGFTFSKNSESVDSESDLFVNEIHQSEVIVYGATPSGIMAAVSAARLGTEVILLEPTDHVGGIVTNGLTIADLIKRKAFGGIFNEYTQRIVNYYEKKYGKESEQVADCHMGLQPEPHVTEVVFHEMLNAENRIKIYYKHRLVKAQKIGNRLVGITLEDLSNNKELKTFQGKIFIDATYEGDLAAAAGAKYRVGRESRNEFNERQAGVIYSRFGYDEYMPGSTGEGDKAIQAFCFRLSMTRVPENRVDVPRPDRYNRQEYVHLIEDIKAGKLAPMIESHLIDRDKLMQPIQLWKKPNGKVEVNSEHIEPVIGAPRESSDLAEENWDYPEASYEVREQIVKRYWDYQLGLIWFLQNDPELPKDYREEARKWGFCKDEFVTNNNVPRQVYVREARRIEGKYFLTQNDAAIIPGTGRTRFQTTSIGIAEYPFDSHACHKYNPKYPKAREGYFYIRHEPFQIPFGVLVPKKTEGLLVTICLSSSHVAFQALRMEPVYMCMGQVAGIAAAQANKSGALVSKIDVNQLQQELVSQKGVISYFEDLYVDDPDFDAFQMVGTIGGIKGYFANPDSFLTAAEAADALRRITGKSFIVKEGKMNNLNAAQLSQWILSQKWNYHGPASGDITVRQFVKCIYKRLS